MKFITIIFALLFALNIHAQDDKTVTLVVSGQGKTQDEAKQNALRSAIEQAFGTFISSKTEILNDSLVKDEIVSVASGNIHKYNIISEVKVNDDNYNVVLNATVSVTKLTSFAQSKGVAIEFDGEIVGLNIQQQMLNEKNEITSMNNISNTCKSILNSSFDYSLPYRGEARQNKLDKDKWDIPLRVDVKFNQNIAEFKRYLTQSILGLSMSSEEIMQYKALGKTTYKVIFGDSSIGGSTSNIDYLKLVTKNNPNIIFKVVPGPDTITTPKLKAAIEIFKTIPEFRHEEIIFFDKSVNPILNFRTESAAIELIEILNYSRNAALNFKVDNGTSSYSPIINFVTRGEEDKFGDFTIISDPINYIFGKERNEGKTISFPLNFITSYYYPDFSYDNRESLKKFDLRRYKYFCNRLTLRYSYPTLEEKTLNEKLETVYNTKFGFVQIVDCLYSRTPRGLNWAEIPYHAVISMFDFKPSTKTILSLEFINTLTLDELKSVKKYEVSRIEPVK